MPTIVNAKIIMVGTLILMNTLCCFGAIAQTSSWQLLNQGVRASCSQEEPCRLRQSSDIFEITFAVEEKGSMRSLTKIKIKNIHTGEVQVFPTQEINKLRQKDQFEMYGVNLRPGMSQDLALYAFSSPREGKVFNYFLYDPARKRFTASAGTYPKLTYDGKTKKYISELQHNKFLIIDHEIKPDPTE